MCVCVGVMLLDNGIDNTVNIVCKLLVFMFGLPHTHTHKSDNIAFLCMLFHVIYWANTGRELLRKLFALKLLLTTSRVAFAKVDKPSW